MRGDEGRLSEAEFRLQDTSLHFSPGSSRGAGKLFLARTCADFPASDLEQVVEDEIVATTLSETTCRRRSRFW